MVLHVSVFKNKFFMKKNFLNVGTFPPFELLGWELYRTPVFNYLLIHSKALKAKFQRAYEAKTQNRLFYDSSLVSHKGGSGGKSDWLSRLFTNGVPIPLNTF